MRCGGVAKKDTATFWRVFVANYMCYENGMLLQFVGFFMHSSGGVNRIVATFCRYKK